MKHKQLNADMTVQEGERAFVTTITSNAVDRDNEVLLPEGMNSKDFEKNPVLFWKHQDKNDVPIGKVVGLKRQGDTWLAKAVLAARHKDHVGEWFPDTVLSLVQQGVVNAVSVGLIPEVTRRPTTKDKEMFGKNVQSVVARWKLLELSVAPLPANQEALIVAVSKSMCSKKTAKAYFGIDLDDIQIKPKTKRKVAIMVFDSPRPRKTVLTKDMAIARAVERMLARMTGQIRLGAK